jgi:chromosome segregation ATPase
METPLSLSAILSSLQTQISQHREREAFHAEREAFHRDRRAEHAAELEQLQKSFESLKASAEHAAKLAARLPQEPPPPSDDLPVGRKVSISQLVQKVIERKGSQEAFGPVDVAAEINQRFGPRLKLKKEYDPRQVSVVLRWMAKTGRIARTQKGRPWSGSQYVRTGG